jgi:hypothetical protein
MTEALFSVGKVVSVLRFTTGERAPDADLIRGWLAPRTGLQDAKGGSS